MKQTHYRIIAAIVGCIILLVIIMASQPPKIETQIVEIEKEKIVTVEKESAYKYNISSVERETLARLVYLEANTESLECQSAIASVVVNRLESGDWGETFSLKLRIEMEAHKDARTVNSYINKLLKEYYEAKK